MARYLVTGGAGFIGSHSVDLLLRQGHEVVVLDDLSTGHRANLAHCIDDIQFVEACITDKQAVADAMIDCKGVLHVAAQVSVPRSIEDPARSAQTNITGFAQVYEQARRAGISKIVYASSAAIYGTNDALPLGESETPAPLSPYGLEKATNEAQAAMFSRLHPDGPACVGLRYFNIFGPRQDPSSQYAGVISKFADNLMQGHQVTIFGDGNQTRDFVYVGDVAAINVAMLQNDFTGVCNVCRNDAVSLNQLADMMADLVGMTSSPSYQPARTGDIPHSRGDCNRLHELGLSTPTLIPDGLKTLLNNA